MRKVGVGTVYFETIVVDENNENYSSVDGVLYNKEQTELIYYPREKKNQEFTVPDTVISMERGAFRNSKNLKKLQIPEGVENIPIPLSDWCLDLTSFDVSENNANYSSNDGILYDKNQTKLLSCPKGKGGEVNLPLSLENISSNAFEECTRLTSVIIPNNVTSVGECAFLKCSSLANVTLSTGVTSYGMSVFCGCTSLEKIVIPEGVTSINAGMFTDCSSLKEVYIPTSVATIVDASALSPKYNPFYGCSSLEKVSVADATQESAAIKAGVPQSAIKRRDLAT